MTAITEEARRHAVAAAATAAASAPAGQREVGSVIYKGEKLPLAVARVPLEHVLLNPRSHRIRAQLQSRPGSDYQTVMDDPYGAHAQQLLRDLLKQTEGYSRIKASLARQGQDEAGVITAGGVLINANTRAVALEELGESYIDVMVLPEDATDRELDELELSLQMARDLKQDYSFTSQLLFIEDLVDAGWGIEELGMRLRPDLPDDKNGRRDARQHVHQELRLLSLIREVIDLSGGAATFVQFDDRRQALIEISDDYEAEKNKRPDDATRVRDAQLAGMLANIDYRRLRGVDLRLLDGYLPTAMREDRVLGPVSDALLSPATSVGSAEDDDPTAALAGLDLLDDDEAAPAGDAATLPSFRTVLTLLARAGDDEFVILPGAEPDEAISRHGFVAAVGEVFETALQNRRDDNDQIDELAKPERFLRDAIRAIDNSRTTFEQVHNRGSFDRDTFLLAREELDRALDQFTDVLNEKLQGTDVDGVSDDDE